MKHLYLKSKVSSLRGFTSLATCKRGNFGMMAAFLIPALMLAGSVSLDVLNLTSLKGRMQAASDSVSLAVATRINKGELSIGDAEEFAKKLLLAQMEADGSRFSNLKITPSVEIVETVNAGVTTYDVKIGGTATQDTTPFVSIFGKTDMSVTIASTAQAGNEEIQGALSLGLVVDVSGSMGGKLPNSQATVGDIQSALEISRTQANMVVNMITKAFEKNGLQSWQIKWIAENYTWAECQGMSTSSAAKAYFLNELNLPSNTNNGQAKQMCRRSSFGSKFVTMETLADNIRTVISYYQPTKKIEALQDASSALFKQLNSADPTQTYVRTGLSAYSSYVRGTINMEWGTSSADAHIKGQYASGGTASTNSVKWAYDQLKASNTAENNAHASKNGQVPDKFMLFMTDGANNRSSDDTATKNYCDTAKAEGIRIFAVAFAAPSRGEALLKNCASSSEDYFDPDTADELIAAFEKIGKSTANTLTRLVN